jgi:hypothetical protein
MIDRRMFAVDRIGRMHGANACGAVIFQSGAMTRQGRAVRTGRCAPTAESRTRTRAASTHVSAAAGAPAAAAGAIVAGRAAGGGAR